MSVWKLEGMNVIFRHQIWLERAVWPQMFCISLNGEVETGLPKSVHLWETFKNEEKNTLFI